MTKVIDKLAQTEGHVSIEKGVLTFEDGTTLPLNATAPNYGVALSGAFTALEAINRARSVGQFYMGNPVHDSMVKLEKDLRNLINQVCVSAAEEGQQF